MDARGEGKERNPRSSESDVMIAPERETIFSPLRLSRDGAAGVNRVDCRLL